MTKVIVGEFSKNVGSQTRIIRDKDGKIYGTIHKVKNGYKIVRLDGKIRFKEKLADAMKSCARAN